MAGGAVFADKDVGTAALVMGIVLLLITFSSRVSGYSFECLFLSAVKPSSSCWITFSNSSSRFSMRLFILLSSSLMIAFEFEFCPFAFDSLRNANRLSRSTESFPFFFVLSALSAGFDENFELICSAI